MKGPLSSFEVRRLFAVNVVMAMRMFPEFAV
jgi:hypothetical protein